MKIKSKHDIFVYFINDNMNFNIDEEQEKLIRIVDDNEFDFLKFCECNVWSHTNLRMNFLWTVTILTNKYPQVELYLKNLLNYFTANELEQRTSECWSILHQIFCSASIISLNTFKIILNIGVNVNLKSRHDNTLVHLLLSNPCDNHIYNILKLLIEYNVDLNIINYDCCTALDALIEFALCSDNGNYEQIVFDFVMLLIDSGARTNVPKDDNKMYDFGDNKIYDFIEHYESSTIKPAIKNENKI